MKLIILTTLLAALALGTAPLQAQTVTTDPVGFFTVDINANSDRAVALGLHRDPDIPSTTVTGVQGNVISISAQLTADQYVYVDGVQDDQFYLLVKDGTLAGRWYEITDNGTGDVTVNQGPYSENVQTQGLVADTSVCIIPFWTLNTLFPDGAGLDANSAFFTPTNFVLLSSQTGQGTNLPFDKVYFYYDGTDNVQPAGWYDNGNPFGGEPIEDTLVPPDSYLVVRNAGSAKTITVEGAVPTTPSDVALVTDNVQQDNQTVNPFPIPVSLNQLQLAQSGAVTAGSSVFSPVDFVLIYDQAQSGQNSFPSKVYFYHDGTDFVLPQGWYDNSNPFAGKVGDDKIIAPGASITIRKAASSPGLVNWEAPRPYTLD